MRVVAGTSRVDRGARGTVPMPIVRLLNLRSQEAGPLLSDWQQAGHPRAPPYIISRGTLFRGGPGASVLGPLRQPAPGAGPSPGPARVNPWRRREILAPARLSRQRLHT